jgi:hypothetical protein
LILLVGLWLGAATMVEKACTGLIRVIHHIEEEEEDKQKNDSRKQYVAKMEEIWKNKGETMDIRVRRRCVCAAVGVAAAARVLQLLLIHMVCTGCVLFAVVVSQYGEKAWTDSAR